MPISKLRKPLTYQATLTHIASLIGWDHCGAQCGVTERSVRYWSDPDCEMEIRLIDAERLDRAFMGHGSDHAPFHRLHALRLDIAARDTPEICLVNIAGKTAKETREAVAAILTASSSKDPRALNNARREIQEAIDALTDGLAALNCDELEGQPA